MKQLHLLRTNALFHSSRVLLCLILFGAVLVTGCTSEAVAVAASSAEPPRRNIDVADGAAGSSLSADNGASGGGAIETGRAISIYAGRVTV
ncbi:hypothetical protein [Stenotrophomonas terrae]|uniref:hypothetical protein n=1 Tax=Stenotrophomonas terrae TaxID=405446 RepID=UPI000B1A5896|nr:hypothetical protein [Stenotrophomonas terrae]